MGEQSLETIEAMYKDGMSGADIGHVLAMPLRQVYRLLDRYDVPRRTSAESNRLKFINSAPSFSVKKNMALKDRLLRIVGVMLYWAEGAHNKNQPAVDFANSNPTMIALFVKFLRDICGVDEKRLRIYLYCYANQNIGEIKKVLERHYKNSFTSVYPALYTE